MLNETEQFVLLSLLHLDEDAHAIPIQREIEERTGRGVSVTTVYAALDRLERRGMVESWLSDPLPERGGRARKLFRVRPEGARALHEEREVQARMWGGLEVHPDSSGGR